MMGKKSKSKGKSKGIATCLLRFVHLVRLEDGALFDA
jgi:hypothetical protein